MNDILMQAFVSSKDAPPSEEQTKWYNDHKGKRVSVNHTGHVGIVHGLNTRSAGLYPGNRYPIYVKIKESALADAVGLTFEYDIEQLTIIEEK